jgi:toxin FitB
MTLYVLDTNVLRVLAATCRVRDFVLVTRNIADFRGRGVRVLDPFKARLEIVTV